MSNIGTWAGYLSPLPAVSCQQMTNVKYLGLAKNDLGL